MYRCQTTWIPDLFIDSKQITNKEIYVSILKTDAKTTKLEKTSDHKFLPYA